MSGGFLPSRSRVVKIHWLVFRTLVSTENCVKWPFQFSLSKKTSPRLIRGAAGSRDTKVNDRDLEERRVHSLNPLSTCSFPTFSTCGLPVWNGFLPGSPLLGLWQLLWCLSLWFMGLEVELCWAENFQCSFPHTLNADIFFWPGLCRMHYQVTVCFLEIIFPTWFLANMSVASLFSPRAASRIVNRFKKESLDCEATFSSQKVIEPCHGDWGHFIQSHVG